MGCASLNLELITEQVEHRVHNRRCFVFDHMKLDIHPLSISQSGPCVPAVYDGRIAQDYPLVAVVITTTSLPTGGVRMPGGSRGLQNR